MEFLRNLGMAIVVGVLMAVYYVVMFLVMGVLVWMFLAIFDAFAKTDFAPRYRRWLSGMQEWRREHLTRKRAPETAESATNETWETA